MKINREEFVNALQIVKPGLATKDLIEQATSFAFQKDRIVTYNDSISISHPIVDMQLTGAIKAEELYQLLSKMKAPEIELKVMGSQIVIKAGKMKSGLALQKEITLPLDEVGEIGDWGKLPKNFTEGLRFTVGNCSNDMSQLIYTCVHCRNKTIEATDRFSITQFYLPKPIPTNNLLLPATFVREIIKLNVTHISVGKGWVHFKTPEDTVISGRVLDQDEFPATDKHLKIKNPITFTLPESTKEILERASIFTKKETVNDETVTIQLEDGEMIIKGKSETGWFREKVKIAYKGEDMQFKIAPSLLRNILSKSNKCQTAEFKIVFQGDNWFYLAMLKVTNDE